MFVRITNINNFNEIRHLKIQLFLESASEKSSNQKMASKWVSKQKLIIGICFLLYYCFGQCYTMFPEDLDSLNIDNFGKKLLGNPEIMNLFRRSLSSSLTSNSRYDTIKCALEVNTIKEGLLNADYWTLKRKLLELQM